jgi:hypothetical protein
MKNAKTNVEITVEEILEMAKTTIGTLGINGHERGYTSILVHIDDNGNIDDADTCWDINEYYNNNCWHRVYKTGTGSYKCNCDPCVNGDDPKDWAGDCEFSENIADEIYSRIDELEQELDFRREQEENN